MLILTAALFFAPAQAQSSERVFVSELQALDKDAAGMASLMSGFLADRLASWPEIEVVTADSAPDFGEHSAYTYLVSCPPGESLGCAYVVGSSVEAPYAVSGTIETVGNDHLFTISIVDIFGAREAVNFSMELGMGEEEYFAEGVAELVLSVLAGDSGIEEDIRAIGATEGRTQEIDADQMARELEQLTEEIGGAESVEVRNDVEFEREEYTVDDLASEMDSDAVKPWERMGMTPGEYMKFKNSGMTVRDWEDASKGRKGQLIVRVGGGVSYGPAGIQYDGRYAIDAATRAVPEVYAWEARTASTAPAAGGWVGFGILPVLEVELGGGYLGGNYQIRMQQEVIGGVNQPSPGEAVGAQNIWAGARVLAPLMPTARLHPIVGGGAVAVIGSALDDHFQTPPGSNLPVFENSWFLMVQGLAGVDVDMTDNFGLYGLVPVGVMVGGRTSTNFSEGSGYLEAKEEPPTVPVVSGGIEVGITLRLFGPKLSDKPVDYLDDDY